MLEHEQPDVLPSRPRMCATCGRARDVESAEDVDVLTCSNCGRRIPEAEAKEAGSRYWSDGIGELVPFCGPCSNREFSAEAPASAEA
jgi:hypothetical protein